MRFVIRDRDAAAKPRRRRMWPRWLKPALMGTAAIAFVGGVGFAAYAVWRDDWISRTLEQTGQGLLTISARAGLAVNEVFVTGRRETRKEDLLAAIDVQRGQPILAVDPEAVRQRIVKLPWIREARVERKLPDTLTVVVEERVPMALWQRQGRLVLVSRDGAIVLRQGFERFGHLPVLVGDDAPREAPALLDLLDSEPTLKRRVTAAIRVGERRWNLQIDNGIDIRLPETDIAAAWAQLAKLEREQKVLGRDVVTIDLRLPDRLVIRVAPDQVKRARGPAKPT
jgi:cell division protein FtsQ